MRKSALVAFGASALMAGGFFIPAFAASTTPPPPTYSTPCGASAETGAAPANPTPSFTPDPSNGGGSGGIIGQNGYLEASGSATGQSGTISGYGTDGQGDGVYGSLSGSGGAPNVCLGVEQGGTYTTPVNQ